MIHLPAHRTKGCAVLGAPAPGQRGPFGVWTWEAENEAPEPDAPEGPDVVAAGPELPGRDGAPAACSVINVFELKAEYEWRTVLLWHVVPAGTSTALCGRFLAPAAQTRPSIDPEDLRGGEVCLRCTSALGLTNPPHEPEGRPSAR